MKRGLFSSKRAEAQDQMLWQISQGVFILLYAFGLMSYLQSVGQNPLLEKNYLSRDLALLVQTAYSSPGNIEFSYTHEKVNLPNYNFLFQEQYVNVVEPGSSQYIFYWYADDLKSNSILNGEARSPKSIQICNIAGKVAVGTQSCGSTAKLECNLNINTIIPPDKKPVILLNPVFGGKETGKVGAEDLIQEKEVARQILLSLKNLDTSSKFQFLSTRDLENDLGETEQLTLDEREQIIKDTNYDILITVSVGNPPPDKNPILAKIPKHDKSDTTTIKKNEKLGCIILNSILVNDFQITSLSPIIADDQDKLLLASKSQLAVSLELGNIEFPQSSLLTDPNKVAKSIYNALIEYYGLK